MSKSGYSMNPCNRDNGPANCGVNCLHLVTKGMGFHTVNWDMKKIEYAVTTRPS